MDIPKPSPELFKKVEPKKAKRNRVRTRHLTQKVHENVVGKPEALRYETKKEN